MNKLYSKFGDFPFYVAKWYFDAYRYVNDSNNKFLFMPNTCESRGRSSVDSAFKGFRYYYGETGCGFDFQVADPPAKLINLKHNRSKTETMCNINVSIYAKGFDRVDIAEIFARNSANDSIKELEALGISKVNLPPHHYDNEKRFYIATQYIENGIGHVCPVLGYDDKGDLYGSNIGDFYRFGNVQLDGINDDSAFCANMEDITFYEITK